jgi:HD-GYP domain-containing protein (c-di-GMP phosphodiesterase class II)
MEPFENIVAITGKSLITNLFILVRMTAIYDSMNEAILNAANKLVSDLNILTGETGEITLKIIQGSFYIEGIRVKTGVSDIESFSSFSELLRQKSIGLLDFRTPIRAEDLITLTYAIKAGAEASDIQSAIEGKLTRGIIVGGPVLLQKEDEIDLKDNRAMALRAYIKALTAIREMDKAIKTGSRTKLKRIKRALQLIVDCILTDESYLLSYAMAKTSGNYHCHAVNVSILSAALGKRVGFSRVQLRTLVMAAFFHDTGKIVIPADIQNKTAGFSPIEQELFKRHPIDGVKLILRSFGLNEISILSMLVSYEHHMKLDCSGYPPVIEKRDINLFSRIVNIANDFDSLITKMHCGHRTDRHYEALKLMSAESGSSYDPFLLDVFSRIFQQQYTPH